MILPNFRWADVLDHYRATAERRQRRARTVTLNLESVRAALDIERAKHEVLRTRALRAGLKGPM